MKADSIGDRLDFGLSRHTNFAKNLPGCLITAIPEKIATVSYLILMLET
jgi:hypothetical protein